MRSFWGSERLLGGFKRSLGAQRGPLGAMRCHLGAQWGHSRDHAIQHEPRRDGMWPQAGL